MTAIQLWCRVTVLGPDGSRLTCYTLEGWGQPDLKAVDDVAHLVLRARRLGGTVVLEQVAPRLSELLDLTGLAFDIRAL